MGSHTDLEVGAAAEWMIANFDFSSSWSFAAAYLDTGIHFSTTAGGTIEVDRSGD